MLTSTITISTKAVPYTWGMEVPCASSRYRCSGKAMAGVRIDVGAVANATPPVKISGAVAPMAKHAPKIKPETSSPRTARSTIFVLVYARDTPSA